MGSLPSVPLTSLAQPGKWAHRGCGQTDSWDGLGERIPGTEGSGGRSRACPGPGEAPAPRPPGLGMLGTQRAGRSDPYARRVRLLVCGSRPGAGVRRPRWRAARGRRRRQRRSTSAPRASPGAGQGENSGLRPGASGEGKLRHHPAPAPCWDPEPRTGLSFPRRSPGGPLGHRALPLAPFRGRKRGSRVSQAALSPPEPAPAEMAAPYPSSGGGGEVKCGGGRGRSVPWDFLPGLVVKAPPGPW